MVFRLPDSKQWRVDLKETRQKRGFSVRELAGRLKVNPAYISLVESGTKIPDEATAEEWAKALGLDVDIFRAWVRAWREQDPSRSSERYAEYQTLSANPELQVMVAGTDQVQFEKSMPEKRSSKGDAIRIPLLPEDADPDSGVPPLEWITVEPELLASVEKPRDPFAYRISSRGVERVNRTLQAGDYAILTRRVMPLEPDEIYGVKSEGGVVLSRIVLKGDRMLVLLSDQDSQQIDVVQSEDENVKSLIVGKVLVVIRPWKYTVVSTSGRPAEK